MAIGVSCTRQNLYDMQPQFERLTDDQWKGIKVFLNWQRPRKYVVLVGKIWTATKENLNFQLSTKNTGHIHTDAFMTEVVHEALKVKHVC